MLYCNSIDTHNIHPIAHQWAWSMEWLLWVQRLVYCLQILLPWFKLYHFTLNYVVQWLHCLNSCHRMGKITTSCLSYSYQINDTIENYIASSIVAHVAVFVWQPHFPLSPSLISGLSRSGSLVTSDVTGISCLAIITNISYATEPHMRQRLWVYEVWSKI